MEATVEFEKLLSLVKREPAASTPDSVRRRYEARLAELREWLQNEHHRYPLGAILVSVGALSDAQLNEALAIQRRSSPSKLLGELLIDLHLVTPEKLGHALAIQRTL